MKKTGGLKPHQHTAEAGIRVIKNLEGKENLKGRNTLEFLL